MPRLPGERQPFSDRREDERTLLVALIIFAVVAFFIIKGMMKVQRRMAYADGLRAARSNSPVKQPDPNYPTWYKSYFELDTFYTLTRAQVTSRDIPVSYFQCATAEDMQASLFEYVAEIERNGGNLSAQTDGAAQLIIHSWHSLTRDQQRKFI